MTEQLKEALSAAVDGEADLFELRRVLDEMERSEALSGAWHRYHRIGEHLRGEQAPDSDQAIRAMGDAVWASFGGADGAAVAVAETAELTRAPTTSDAAPPAPTPLWKRLAPAAIAASVAAAVLVGLGGIEQDSAPQVADNQIEIEGPVMQYESEVSPSDVQRANAYMLHHVQQKAMNNPGVASFVKVVTFEKAE